MSTSPLTHPGAPGIHPARPAIAIAAAAAVVGLTVAFPSSSRMLTWPWIVLTAVIWLTPVLALLWRVAAAKTFHLPNRAATVGLVLLAIVAVISAGVSPFSATSLAHTWPTLAGVALTFLVRDLIRRDERTAAFTMTVVSVCAAIVVLASCVAWLATAAPALWTNRNAYPFGHSNYTAGFIVLVVPWFVGRAFASRAIVRGAWAAVVAIALFTLAGTSSRGAVLALLVVAAIATLIGLRCAPWSRRQKAFALLVVCVVGVASVFANSRLRELVLHGTWSASASESNRQRAAMLTAGRALGELRPWLGWGPGTVPLAYPHVRARLDGGVDNVLELHSTPAQLWATLGIAGVVAAILLLGGAAIVIMRRTAVTGNAAAAAASLAGYALFSLTEHQLDLPAMTALVAINFALLTAGDAGDTLIFSSGGKLAAVVGLLGLGIAPTGALWSDIHARQIYAHALDALESGNPDEAVQALDAATRVAPHDPYFQHEAVGVVLNARNGATNAKRQTDLAREAITRLESSLRTRTHEEFGHFNLGWLYLDLGDSRAAARHFIAAARLVPDKGGVYFGLGLALQAADQRESAIRAFALEWINDPRSITSPAWEIPALAELRPAIEAEIIRRYSELSPQLAHASVAAAWTLWWLGEPVDPAQLGRGFSAEAAEFIDALPAINSHASVDAAAPWATLYRAWTQQRFAVPAVASDAATAAALSRRAQRHPTDFISFLRAGTEDEPALLRTYRRSRTGYGVLAFHPDGPVLSDAYVVQENRVVTDFAAGLFPPKGWLPGRFLLAWLPPAP